MLTLLVFKIAAVNNILVYLMNLVLKEMREKKNVHVATDITHI